MELREKGREGGDRESGWGKGVAREGEKDWGGREWEGMEIVGRKE